MSGHGAKCASLNPLERTINDVPIARFAYQPLKPSSDNIRLATVLSVNSDEIHCTLQTYSLAADPKFIALSYAWGAAQDKKTLLIDGKLLEIRTNLWLGLQQMHATHLLSNAVGPVMFWADALCIDQNNDKERGHQVNMMRDIYSSASSVIVWLGPASEHSDEAMDLIAEEKFWKGSNQYLIDQIDPKLAQAVTAVLERPYWRRLWIVQEIMMAKDLTFLCGGKKLEWEWLSGWLWSRVFDFTDLKTQPTRAFDVLYPKIISLIKDPMPIRDLHWWLVAHSRQECEDVRDKIFGLLGMVDFKDGHSIEADYTLSPAEVHKLVMDYFDKTAHFKPGRGDAAYMDRLCRNALGLDE